MGTLGLETTRTPSPPPASSSLPASPSTAWSPTNSARPRRRRHPGRSNTNYQVEWPHRPENRDSPPTARRLKRGLVVVGAGSLGQSFAAYAQSGQPCHAACELLAPRPACAPRSNSVARAVNATSRVGTRGVAVTSDASDVPASAGVVFATKATTLARRSPLKRRRGGRGVGCRESRTGSSRMTCWGSGLWWRQGNRRGHDLGPAAARRQRPGYEPRRQYSASSTEPDLRARPTRG